MSEFRGSWALKKVGELISLDYGRSLGAAERRGEGYPVYGSSGEIGKHSSFLVEGPGIVVGRKGTVGAVVWSSDSFWPIDTTYFVRWLSDSAVNRRWTYWRLHGLPLRRLDSSTGVPGLNRNDVYDLAVPVPPLREQQRIAEILDTVDEAIRSTERLVAKLEQAKRGLLHDLFTRGIDESGCLRGPRRRSMQFKQSRLGTIPASWSVSTLNAVSRRPGEYGSLAAAIPYSPDLPRYVRITDIDDNGRLRPESRAGIPEQAARSYMLRDGDLCFARTGATVGKSYLYSAEDGRCVFAGYVIRFPIDDHLANPAFVWLWTQAAQYWSWVNGIIQQGAQPNINARIYGEHHIPVPPRGEQDRIVQRAFSLIRAQSVESMRLSKLQDAKVALMDDLLTGRVRVKVAEVASV